MSKYSTKTHKKEFNDQIIKAAKLQPITASVETVRIIKTILPSLGSLGDSIFSQDRSLAFATCLNLFSQNSTLEHFESLQVLLLGSILDSNDEPLSTPEKINSWLENNTDLNSYDLMVWLFSENLLKGLLESDLVKNNMSKLDTVKSMFSDMFAPLPQVTETVAEDEAITE